MAPLMATVSSRQRGSWLQLATTSWMTFGKFLVALSLGFSNNVLNDKMEVGIVRDMGVEPAQCCPWHIVGMHTGSFFFFYSSPETSTVDQVYF